MEEASKSSLIAEWTEKQQEFAEKVNHCDKNDWSHLLIAPTGSSTRDMFFAGADISFSTTDVNLAVGTITIVKLSSDGKTELVYSKSRVVKMPHPYVPSFLGFREAPVVSDMLSSLPHTVRRRIDCLLLDGNGILHPRKAGLACQVGIKEDLPTVGVAKALLCIDGLDEMKIRQEACSSSSGVVDVIGESKYVWGKAIMTGNATNKPIYVSVGHRVSLTTAAVLVKRLCEYRIPAPIRFADMHSRSFLRGAQVHIFHSQEFL